MSLLQALVNGVMGDNNKGYHSTHRCPYFLCPSNEHLRHPDREFHLRISPPRMKFVEKIQPSVYQYRCLDCGCPNNKSLETLSDGRQCWVINPALIGGRPTHELWGGARCR